MNDIFDMPTDANVDVSGNFAVLGDDLNIIEKDPTLKRVLIGAGWDDNAFNADALDADLSLFLLDKNQMTRVDEDFVFYNQKETLEGAVRHHGDSRTGAGEGDDETVSIQLEGLPFDIMQIMIVISLYKGYEKEQNVDMLRNVYVRIVNEDTDEELVRYRLDPDMQEHDETAVIAAALNREGPKWHFKPLAECVAGGLGEIATRYGCVINQQ